MCRRNGALAFSADNPWNIDISTAAVDPDSDALIASIGLDVGLHPDFGAGLYNGAPIGIPYVVVGGAQAGVAVAWTAYGNESDPGPYPVPRDAPIEGGLASSGDRHVLVIDRDQNRLYELVRTFPNPDGSWNADAGAVFHLDSNNVRPGAQPGWTSADAAGLPIFPGLARYEEAALGPGGIRRAALHGAANAPRLCAARDALGVIRHQHKPAADGHAGAPEVELCDPAGLQRRDPRAADRDAKLRMIVADNGSDWYVSGAPDARWNNDALVGELRQVRGSAFEVVRMDGLVAGA